MTQASSLLMRRNSGTLRALFDEPAIGTGTDELRADLSTAIAGGLIPPHDTEYMAAAMVGAGIELALRMVEREPPDVQGATAMAAAIFVPALRGLG
jgi:hypothetical protein